jgi:hypothetical protein
LVYFGAEEEVGARIPPGARSPSLPLKGGKLNPLMPS